MNLNGSQQQLRDLRPDLEKRGLAHLLFVWEDFASETETGFGQDLAQIPRAAVLLSAALEPAVGLECQTLLGS